MEVYDALRTHMVPFFRPAPIQEEDDSESDTSSLAEVEREDYEAWLLEQQFIENTFNPEMFGIPILNPETESQGSTAPAS